MNGRVFNDVDNWRKSNFNKWGIKYTAPEITGIMRYMLAHLGEIRAKVDSIASDTPAREAANDNVEDAGCSVCRSRGNSFRQLIALYPRQFSLIGILGICIGAMFM